MKYKLLSVGKSFHNKKINIGDYVQAVAASQFLPAIDGFVDRDMDLTKIEEETKVIMNGWFMYNPENWPPSDKVSPLFVAFHMNTNVRDKLTEPLNISYFKKHEPIGCRDYDTAEFLSRYSIKAYFSGCLTLTLGYKYKSERRTNKVLIVDPSNSVQINLKNILRAISSLSRNWNHIKVLWAKNIGTRFSFIIRLFYIALYYDSYSTIISEETLLDAVYIEHESMHYRLDFKTEKDRFEEAERLVKLYSEAGLVLTSRIHCALPCLGLGTPVLFIENVNQDKLSGSRMRGLRDLFNRLDYNDGTITTNFEFKSKLSVNNCPSNFNTWNEYASSLIERCKAFVSPK